jgi:hypothetical protein
MDLEISRIESLSCRIERSSDGCIEVLAGDVNSKFSLQSLRRLLLISASWQFNVNLERDQC